MTSLPKFSVDNPVLVHVLMLAILVGGVYSALTLVRDMFPESRPNQVAVTTPYPGATPLEVEKGVALRLEEAIKDVADIEKIETRISEGLSTILVTLTNDARDIDQKVNEFKAAIDTVPRDELPEDAEETHVTKLEPRLPVISVALFGDVSEATLKDAGRELRDELLLLSGVSDVVLSGTRKAELRVEVQPEKLIEYRLGLAQVADAIRQSNLDLPGGQLKTPDQNVALRILGETDEAEQISDTIVRTAPTGEVVRVRDLGTVVDGFEDKETRGRFNGKPAVDITVFKTGRQDAIDIAAKVRACVAGRRGEPLELDWAGRLKRALGLPSALQGIHERASNTRAPAGVELFVHGNLARYVEGRLGLLKRNGLWGLSLVFLSLLLFLNWRVAFWVMMGLVLSLCGALILMNAMSITLNFITMFGLIVVLGLIVDDAIVVGENIYARTERGDAPRTAAVKGTEEVTWPVTIAVLTTIGAFLPLRFIEGRMGDFMGVLPVVVMCALGVSLIEAFSILPSHLAEWIKPVRRDLSAQPPRHRLARLIQPLRRRQMRFMQEVLGHHYERLLRTATDYRYVTVAFAVALLLLSAGVIRGERVPFVFIQKMDSETIMADLEMPVGTPAEQTEVALRQVEDCILGSRATSELASIYTLVGAQASTREFGVDIARRSHVGQIIIELTDVERRDRSSDEIINELRRTTGNIVGVSKLNYHVVHGGPGGTDIEIEITGQSIEGLLAVADTLKAELATSAGTYDIEDGFEQGRRELQIELLDSARPLELTTRALATEVRGAFFGLKARTLQRDREDVDIRVRFPESRRRHIYELESMRIAAPGGVMVPFCEVARLIDTRGYASIRRVDQRRAVVVSCDVDHTDNTPEAVLGALAPTIAALESRYPGVRIDFAGTKRETMRSMGSLRRDFGIAMLVIYVMLAGLFRSYVQPLVVLVAVPFGMVGAVAGHYILGYPLTVLSMIGIVALSGIVVNDALILVDFINKERRRGTDVVNAVILGGRRRLRPILLTSLTTILGLAPLMVEPSFQAKFLIPMAISISAGLAFATVLTLIVVPSIYLIAEDLKRIFGPSRPETEPQPIG